MRNYNQLELKVFPLPIFECPVSKVNYNNIYEHNRICKYTFCKKNRWRFSNEENKTQSYNKEAF